MLLSQFPATLRLRCLAGIRAAVAGGQNYTPSTAAVSVFFLLFVDGSLRPFCRGKAIPTGKLLQRSETAFDSNHGVNTRSFLGRLRTIRKLPAGTVSASCRKSRFSHTAQFRPVAHQTVDSSARMNPTFAKDRKEVATDLAPGETVTCQLLLTAGRQRDIRSGHK